MAPNGQNQGASTPRQRPQNKAYVRRLRPARTEYCHMPLGGRLVSPPLPTSSMRPCPSGFCGHRRSRPSRLCRHLLCRRRLCCRLLLFLCQEKVAARNGAACRSYARKLLPEPEASLDPTRRTSHQFALGSHLPCRRRRLNDERTLPVRRRPHVLLMLSFAVNRLGGLPPQVPRSTTRAAGICTSCRRRRTTLRRRRSHSGRWACRSQSASLCRA